MEETLLWTQPEWIARAHAWINEAVRETGSQITGEIEQPYLRPWSTVMRVPTSGGLLFFKAAIPPMSSEMAVLPALARDGADCLPELVAADAQRGWMLIRDAGSPVRALLHTPEDLGLLDPLIPKLSALQMAWMGREEELISLGLPDHRVHRLPAMFERLMADRSVLMVGEENGLTPEQYEQAKAAVPLYREFCEKLMRYPIVNSIHYDDMHSGNIYLSGEGSGARAAFLDWGDSSVSHPFSSMLIFLRAMSDQMNLPEDSTEIPENMPPMLARLRDLYLEPWQRYDTRKNLLDAFHLAWRVGMVARALSWQESNAAMPEAFRPKYSYYVPAWIGEFLLALPR